MNRQWLISGIVLVCVGAGMFAGCASGAEQITPSNPLIIDATPEPGASPPPAVTPPPESTYTPPPVTTPEPEPESDWQATDLEYKIIEKNDSWWKFSWQFKLKNNTSSSGVYFITVNFLDRNGFIVDYDIDSPSKFNPGEQRTVRATTLIDTDVAPDVKSAEVEIEAY